MLLVLLVASAAAWWLSRPPESLPEKAPLQARRVVLGPAADLLVNDWGLDWVLEVERQEELVPSGDGGNDGYIDEWRSPDGLLRITFRNDRGFQLVDQLEGTRLTLASNLLIRAGDPMEICPLTFPMAQEHSNTPNKFEYHLSDQSLLIIRGDELRKVKSIALNAAQRAQP